MTDTTRLFFGHRAVVVAPRFAFIGPFSEGLAAFSTSIPQPRDFGYIDTTGNPVIPQRFAKAHAFRKGVAIVALRTRFDPPFDCITQDSHLSWGLIDPTGRFVVQPVHPDAYDAGDSIYFGSRYGNILSGPGVIFFRTRGTLAEWGNERISTGHGMPDCAPHEFVKAYARGFWDHKKIGKYGYTDLSGRWVIKPRFASAERFWRLPSSPPRAVVYTRDAPSPVHYTGAALIGPDGSMICEPIYEQIAFPANHGLPLPELETLDLKVGIAVFPASTPNLRRCVHIDSNGTPLYRGTFDDLGFLSRDGLATAGLGQGGSRRYGIINRDGDFLIPARYESCEPLTARHFLAQQSGRIGILGRDERWILDPVFSDMATYASEAKVSFFVGDAAGRDASDGRPLCDGEYMYRREVVRGTSGVIDLRLL